MLVRIPYSYLQISPNTINALPMYLPTPTLVRFQTSKKYINNFIE